MPSRALLTESQTIPAADITQALTNVGVSRVTLGSDVTRTSATGTTLTNTGLTALTVTLAQSSRYRLTYRLYLSSNLSGVAGMKYGFTFPASLTKFDASAISVTDVAGSIVEIYSDWASTAYGSGDAIIDVLSAQTGGMIFTAEIKTGSTANTYGDFAIVLAQAFSSAGTVTMSQNSCVEVLKF